MNRRTSMLAIALLFVLGASGHSSRSAGASGPTVTGRVVLMVRSERVPIRGALITATESKTGKELGRGWASASPADAGRFEISLSKSVSMDLSVHALSEHLSVADPLTGRTYRFVSRNRSPGDVGDIAVASGKGPALFLFDTAARVRQAAIDARLVDSKRDWPPILWAPDIGTGGLSFYNHLGSSVLMDKDAWSDRFILGHELGHVLMDWAMGDKEYGQLWQTAYLAIPSCVSHTLELGVNEACALIEGWADFVQAPLLGSRTAQRSDLETIGDGKSCDPTSEVRAAGVLWDLNDPPNEQADRIAVELVGIADAMKGQSLRSLDDLLEVVVQAGLVVKEDMQLLLSASCLNGAGPLSSPGPATAGGVGFEGCDQLLIIPGNYMAPDVRLFRPEEKRGSRAAQDPSYVYLAAKKEAVVIDGPPLQWPAGSKLGGGYLVRPRREPAYQVFLDDRLLFVIEIDDYEDEVLLGDAWLCLRGGQLLSRFVFLAWLSGVAHDVVVSARLGSTELSSPPVDIESR